MISSFFNKSKFNYLFLIIIIIFSVPIFFSINIVDLNISILTGVGYVSQQLGYTIDDFVGIAFPISILIIMLSPLLLIISKQNILNILSFDLILISIISIIYILYIQFFYNFISIRVIKTCFTIIFFLFCFNLFQYLLSTLTEKQIENIVNFFIFFINLIVIIILINTYISYNKYSFIFSFSNYQYSTYFPYFIYLLFFVNTGLIIRDKKNIYFFSFIIIYGLLSIFEGIKIINTYFLGIFENYFIGICFILNILIILIKIINDKLKVIQNLNIFLFINAIVINVIVVSLLSFGIFYNYVPQIDERVRNFYFATKDMNYLSILGLFQNKEKIIQIGTAHNDLLELFSIFGIFIFFIYKKIFISLNIIFKKDFLIYSSLLIVIFIGGMSTTVLMSLYFNYFLALMITIYEKKK